MSRYRMALHPNVYMEPPVGFEPTTPALQERLGYKTGGQVKRVRSVVWRAFRPYLLGSKGAS